MDARGRPRHTSIHRGCREQGKSEESGKHDAFSIGLPFRAQSFIVPRRARSTGRHGFDHARRCWWLLGPLFASHESVGRRSGCSAHLKRSHRAGDGDPDAMPFGKNLAHAPGVPVQPGRLTWSQQDLFVPATPVTGPQRVVHDQDAAPVGLFGGQSAAFSIRYRVPIPLCEIGSIPYSLCTGRSNGAAGALRGIFAQNHPASCQKCGLSVHLCREASLSQVAKPSFTAHRPAHGSRRRFPHSFGSLGSAPSPPENPGGQGQFQGAEQPLKRAE